MNIVHELRSRKGIQQKELALELGVSNAAVSNWEKGRSDPSGERLKRLSEIFEVDPLVILGQSSEQKQNKQELTETNKIIQQILAKLEDQPKTEEARILAKWIDKLSPEQRKQALTVYRLVFANHAEYFEKGQDNDDT